MGIWPSGTWEAVNSATEMIKKSSPDLSPIKNAVFTTYSVGCNSVRSVKDATCNAGLMAVTVVRDNGSQMVKNCIPSPESVEKISAYVIHPASKEFVKHFVPGVTPVLSIAGALLKDNNGNTLSTLNEKKSELLQEQLKLIKAENELLKAELERKKLEYLKTTQTPSIMESRTIVAQKPEDVISIFMMKGLNIKDLTANQFVPIRGGMAIEFNDTKEGHPKSVYSD